MSHVKVVGMCARELGGMPREMGRGGRGGAQWDWDSLPPPGWRGQESRAVLGNALCPHHGACCKAASWQRPRISSRGSATPLFKVTTRGAVWGTVAIPAQKGEHHVVSRAEKYHLQSPVSTLTFSFLAVL